LSNNIACLLFLALFLRIVPSRRLRERLLQYNKVLKKIWQADIICSIAGGDSFSDTYGLGRFIYVSLPQILVQLLGKPLVLLPQTLGPFKGAFAKSIARYIFKHARIVYTRELSKLETIRGVDLSGNRRLAFGYDMGFALEPEIRAERVPLWLAGYDKTIPLVGLNVSGLLYMGGYTRRNMFGIKVDYHNLILKLIEYFVRNQSAKVVLVPHVFGTGVDSESDLKACRKIYNDADDRLRDHLHLIKEEYDQHEIKAIIGHCDFFLGSRMHACIAAISQCIPGLGLAYSRKFQGVFKAVGMEDLVIDLRKHDENAVLTAVDQVYQRRSELREQLKIKIPSVRASALGLFGRIFIEGSN
jgi:polysaccharide pyruvyl transferase WcaK-like protein